MTKIGIYAGVTVVMLVAGIFTGCIGIGSKTPTYSLMVTVVDDAAGTPIAGASVKVVGKELAEKETNASGQVSFSKLTGSVEILVAALGFVSQVETVAMNKEQMVTIRLAIDATGTVVRDADGLEEALCDQEVKSIVVAEDLVLSTKLVIDRPVKLDLRGKTITGDVEYSFEDPEELELVGSGQIDGDLIVNAPNAAVTNRLQVTGSVSIIDVAGATWHEYATGNNLVVLDSDLEVNIYNGAESIEIGADTWGIRLKIHGGTVAELTANSSVTVWGGDLIKLAAVNSFGVVFDLSPQEVGGDFNPTIIQSFVPGTGGTIPALTPATLEPETFGGLYVQRYHRWPSINTSTGHPEVDMYFPTPASLGGDGYVLQYFDPADMMWKQYGDIETSSAESDNFSITYWSETRFRLMMVGGPLDGCTSNEIEVPVSPVHTYFSNWGMSGSEPYVGEIYTGYAAAKRISDGSTVDESYFSYQWYRVDPITMEMEPIPGATSIQYTTQNDDVGCALLLRATGDGTNIGGAVQIFASSLYDQSPKPILIPNKAYISDVGPTGLTLNLHKKIASLAKEEIVIWAYGLDAPNEPLEIKSVAFVPGSQAKIVIEADIPAGLESIWLTAKTGNWGTVSNYRGEGVHYIRSEVIYNF